MHSSAVRITSAPSTKRFYSEPVFAPPPAVPMSRDAVVRSKNVPMPAPLINAQVVTAQDDMLVEMQGIHHALKRLVRSLRPTGGTRRRKLLRAVGFGGLATVFGIAEVAFEHDGEHDEERLPPEHLPEEQQLMQEQDPHQGSADAAVDAIAIVLNDFRHELSKLAFRSVVRSS